MYHPYFRGKQYDLLTVRENAELLASSKFVPIIEPVRGTLSGLRRALLMLAEAGGCGIVIVNPGYGDLKAARDPLAEFLNGEFAGFNGINAGILLKEKTQASEAMRCFEAHINHHPVLIHSGFTEPKRLLDLLGPNKQAQTHVFVENYAGKLYQRHFLGTKRVLLRDGFKKRKRNGDYPYLEFFSDLHVTYPDEGMDGFGDFLVVGDEYSESGGPAYAIAIHLSFIDSREDSVMKVYHFVSDSQDTPKDPAGKFGEALRKLVRELDKPGSQVLETEAVKEFRELHQQGHFPGLGYVKKLSMSHHMATLSHFLTTEQSRREMLS